MIDFLRHLVPFIQDISPAPVPPKQPKRWILGQGLFVSTVNIHTDMYNLFSDSFCTPYHINSFSRLLKHSAIEAKTKKILRQVDGPLCSRSMDGRF